MARYVVSAAALVIGSVVLGAALEPRDTAQAEREGSQVRMLGCLQLEETNGSLAGTVLGTSADPATAGREANLQQPVGYVLADATPAADARVSRGVAHGSDEPSSTSRQERTTYALVGNYDEFATHRGHRVEITGTIVPATPSGTGSPRAGNQNSALGTGVKRLRVSAMKMVAAACTR